MGTRSEIFSTSENGGGGDCDFGFGLGLRMNQHNNSSSPSLPSNQQPGGYGGAGGGPFSWNSNNHMTCRNEVYDVVGGSGSGSGAITLPMSLNHQSSSSAPPFTVSGGGMGAPFTVAQWEELQRQSVIYKYMEASVPVPPELIIPFTKPLGRGSVELGFSSNKDQEPWRCRRTDGKKWRCTRDVVPDQKYCERHSHKGRHRSRKPVELRADMPYQKPCSVFVNQSQRKSEEQLCSFPSSVFAASYEQSRCLDWFVHGETMPVSSSNSNQEWLNMMMQPIPKLGLKRHDNKLCFLNDSYTGFGHGDLIPNQTQQTRLFIDARSAAEKDEIAIYKSSVSSNGKLPFSCLTLSMSGGDDTGQEDEIGQMGVSSMEELKPNWTSSVSWMNSPPGGPLGEALCLGIASSASSTTTSTSKSSYGDGGHKSLNFIN